MYFYDCLNDIKHFLAYNFQEFREKMKYKKTIILLLLVVFLLSIAGVSASEIGDTIASENANTIELSTDNDIIEDNLQTSEENEALASTDYDEAIAQTDTEVLGEGSAKYSDLAEEIRHSGNITLIHKNYTYDWGAILISEDNKVIDGNGAVIDMNGSTIRAFHVSGYGVTIKNLTIKNANYDGDGGAIYFGSTGTVTNCNFINNKATTDDSYGGAVCMYSGTVENCNFVNNYASTYGGAIMFSSTGTVSNCNFAGNNATHGGAVYFHDGGSVSNCNFINNKATGTGNYDGGGAVYFYNDGTGSVTNCNFTDNTATREGGAVYFNGTGEVTNCTFVNNSAIIDGGAILMRSGSVENCNFTDNRARSGGGVYIVNMGTVSICNFINNTATDEGGAVMLGEGTVINCNFTGNTVTGEGGAIRIDYGIVLICKFTNNSANNGGAIFGLFVSDVTFDTCILKTDSDTITPTRILPPTLNVDNFTTFYGTNEKLTFDLKTNSSIPVPNGNISISVYFKGNNSWVGNYSCLSGEGWIPDLRVGSYYAIFDTEYAEFQPVNRSITVIIPVGKYYVNVTSLATNNKTVNITAKTNVPKNITWDGKLLFILPNGTQIEATYGANGTWWAEHTFDDYSEYKVNATYVGLDNVTVNNGTITINKVNSTITLDNIVLDYGETKNVTVTTTGATGITAKIDGNNVTVINNYTIQIPVLDAGTYNLTVTTITDDDHNPITKEVNITVNKVNSTLTVGDIVFDYSSSGSIIVSVTGADGVNANVVGQPKAVVKVNGTNITVSDLDAGTYTLTVTAIADKNHNNITKNATITVNKLKTELTGNAITITYNVNKDLVITLKDSTGKALSGVKVTVDLNGAKTYTADKNGQVKVSTKGLAPKAYTAKVTFSGDTNYDKSTKDIKVTVKKATPKLTAKKKTYKTTPKTKKYTIVLKDNTGKAIKKAKVTLKVKGKTYKATTNSKGKATFKITKLNKKGTFKATITYKGNKYYNKISKKAKIKVIVTFKTVSKGSKDKATVKEIQQALKDKGYYLTYQGHYLKVDGKFKGCTERSLKEFQKDNGLKVTGKVDEKTAKKLGIL